MRAVVLGVVGNAVPAPAGDLTGYVGASSAGYGTGVRVRVERLRLTWVVTTMWSGTALLPGP